MRLLIVAPRHGAVAGGAEALLASYATLLARRGHDVEIATTCALDHHTWANELPSGTHVEGDRIVHRFPVVSPGRPRGALEPTAPFTEQLRWFGDGMWCPELSTFLRAEAGGFDAIIAGPYLFGTTIWSVLEHPQHTFVVPCLHDESEAHSQVIGRMLRHARGCLFNSEPERALARRLHGDDIDGAIVGLDIDPTRLPPDPDRPRLPRDYLVYCGRMEAGKGVPRVFDAVQAHNHRHADLPIDLVLLGDGPIAAPEDARIHALGYVSESTKRTVLARARALVSFSTMESLSIVALEAWREGTPVITGTDCAVLRWQVERSGGGFAVATTEAFSIAVNALADPLVRSEIGARGSALVRGEYAPNAVADRLEAVLAQTRGGR